MLLDLSEEDLKIIRQGLMGLPIKVALDTLVRLDDPIVKEKKRNIAMAKVEGKDGRWVST